MHIFNLRLAGLLSAALTLLPGSGVGQPVKLTAFDAEGDDNLGYAVALSGDTLVAGAWQNDSLRANAGAAYVFERAPGDGDWDFVVKLTPDNDDFAGDQFAISVAIDGDLLVAGAPFDDDAGNDRGAAYVFERGPAGSWGQVAKLTADDGAFRDFFGLAVAISGTRIVVAAPEDDDMGRQSGSVYVFERNPGDGSWSQVGKLTAADGETGDLFGLSVAISGETILVGADEHSHDAVNNGGAAYIFQRQGRSWVETAELLAMDSDELDRFGGSVALDGDRALVGAAFDDDEDNAGGSAYIFERLPESAAWVETARLNPVDASLGDEFGFAVALRDGWAVIGALEDDDQGQDSGSAYLFQQQPDGSWIEFSKLTAGDGAPFDEFSFSVSLDQGVALVGSPRDDVDGTDDAGSASLFELPSDLIFQQGFED